MALVFLMQAGFLLLEAGADATIPDREGNTPFLVALEQSARQPRGLTPIAVVFPRALKTMLIEPPSNSRA